jgi:D-alanyl-D-alanine carboxypeptidase
VANGRNVKALTILGLISLSPVPLTAQSSASPAISTVATTSLTDAEFSAFLSRFQTKLDGLRVKNKLPGITAAVVFPDGRLAKFASGYADVDRKILMSPDSRMLGASTGKTYVATLALQLADEGRWSLDDKLSKYLGSEEWFKRLPNHDDITLKMLLRHRSGIDDYPQNPEFLKFMADSKKADPNFMVSQKAILNFVLDKPALFEADRGYSYTDIGYILLGLALERMTKRSYYDLVKERFLDPQTLTLTTRSDTRRIPGLAQGYANGINPLVLVGPKMVGDDGTLGYDPGIEFAGGGFAASSGDLAKWAMALYGGRVLKSASLASMLERPANQPQDKEKSPFNDYYGMGVDVFPGSKASPATYGHDGYIPGYITNMVYLPKYNAAFAYQTNTEDGVFEQGKSGPDYQGIKTAVESALIDAIVRKPHTASAKRGNR